ncbi:high mobility group B protein 14 [Morus notabilis]|uniref:high mobility group B protein 14 n=1 Tax=Morus notabilis TaxID=981085 RepID=UPI000CED2BF7|nr:high mobility group B protein 14 [Morus notabilis]
MAKEAKHSLKSRSSKPTERPPNQRMVLRVRTIEGNKRLASLSSSSINNEETTVKKAKTKQKKKNKSKNFDAKKPKKPPTAFFYFLEDFRKEFQKQNPGVKSMRDIGKACGEKWKTMTYEEKVQYYDIATEKRAEFDRATAEYIKRKESGEDEETEDDDSEFDE